MGLGIGILTSSLSACAAVDVIKPPAGRVRSQDQAATMMVSATMVAPWDNVSAALKPAFTMNGDTAAGEVLPTTEQIQNSVLNAFGGSLGIGLSGSVPTAPTGVPAAGQLPAAPAISGGLSLDPVLKYKAANYLNQEIQLLNAEVDNAALRNCYVPYAVKLKLAVMDYRPRLTYSVHTRVSFFTGADGIVHKLRDVSDNSQSTNSARLAPNAPDNFALNEKFGSDIIGLNIDDIRLNEKLDKYPNDIRNIGIDFGEDIGGINMKYFGPNVNSIFDPDFPYLSRLCQTASDLPVVVPFLVADDMEVAMKSRAVESAQQIAAALSFMTHGVGGNVGINNLKQTLTATSNYDLSSTLTVTRDIDNTLYVKVSPNNESSSQPNLSNQTYDVAVLLLVPRKNFVWCKAISSFVPPNFGGLGSECNDGDANDLGHSDIVRPLENMSIVTYTDFRDAGTGKVLAKRQTRAYNKQIKDIITPFLIGNAVNQWKYVRTKAEIETISQPLFDRIQTNDYHGFLEYLIPNGQDIWDPTVQNFCGNLNDSEKSASSTFKRKIKAVEHEVKRNSLLEWSSPSSYQGFPICIDQQDAPALWTALSSMGADSSFKTLPFAAPSPLEITIPYQTVVAADDKTHPIQVQVGGVTGQSVTKLGAYLTLEPPAANKLVPREPEPKKK